MPSRDRLVRKRDRVFPYSKGLMAQSLMAAGLPPDRAYRVARVIDVELRRGDSKMLTTDELRERVHDVLLREEGPDALRRYRRWSRVRKLDRPLLLLIGGAPGSGKSTVASEVAHRFGITRVVSTDVVRQVMRGVLAPDLVPQLHASSYEAGRSLPAGGQDVDRAIVGFLQQVETLRVGLRGVVDRAIQERTALVLEGVHLVPGSSIVEPAAHATVFEVLLAVEDEEQHQAHFFVRGDHTGQARPVDRYLRSFGEIRRIQNHLLSAAVRHGVPVVEGMDLDAAVRSVMDMILERVVEEGEAELGGAPLTPPGAAAAFLPA